MKQFKLSLLAFLFVLPLSAQQLVPDGYYRARNSDTGRYITVIDGYGKVDYQSTSVDLGAIQTERNFEERVCSNPASVIYSKYCSSGYTFYCQGTNTYKITGVYLLVRQRNNKYQLYATKSGTTLYLSDVKNEGIDSSTVATEGSDTKNWETIPLSTTSTNYFGMRPTFSHGSNYYLSFYAGFPFSFYSAGMEAYYVKQVDNEYGVAVWEKWQSADIPEAMPILVKCTASQATDNRLDIHTSAATPPTDNLLKGVYFFRYRRQTANPHRDVTPNDTATMRVFGTRKDGSLGMIKYGGVYIPKNTCYLKVNPGTPDELRLMTEAEFEEYKRILNVTILTQQGSNQSSLVIYDLTGQRVHATSTKLLKHGIYIINGRKTIIP